jgi:hypothetical protein
MSFAAVAVDTFDRSDPRHYGRSPLPLGYSFVTRNCGFDAGL